MQPLITLTCPSCGARVNIAEHAEHLGTYRFTCEYCGNQHMLQMNVQPAAQPAASAAPAIRPRVPVPSEIKIERDGKSACIIRRWFSIKYIPLAFFAVVWDGFLIFWYTMAFSLDAPLVFKLFPFFHLAVGIYITYTTLAGFLNRTTVELTQDELSVWHEPVPWFGEKTIKVSELKQLYCKENVTNGKHGQQFSYDLYAVTTDFREVRLLSGLERPDVARFLEQQLESWMHIADQPVFGEINK